MSYDRAEVQKKLHYILQSKNDSLAKQFQENCFGFDPSGFPVDIRRRNPAFESYYLELGCGWGEFALEYSKRHPEIFYLAMDKKRYRIKKCLKLQSHDPRPNLQWLVGNLDWVFNGMFADQSFDRIIINFPDPWPKKRHTKHRFIRLEFIEELCRILSPGGLIEFATDSWDYMESALSDFNSAGRLENLHGKNVILSKIEDRPVSFFEDLKKNEGENIYFIQLRKFS